MLRRVLRNIVTVGFCSELKVLDASWTQCLRPAVGINLIIFLRLTSDAYAQLCFIYSPSTLQLTPRQHSAVNLERGRDKQQSIRILVNIRKCQIRRDDERISKRRPRS